MDPLEGGSPMNAHNISFTINGSRDQRDVASNVTLLSFLREELGLTGTKSGCDTGECGACTVLLNGEPVNACLVLAAEIEGAEITTIEGLARDDRLDPLQQSFIELTGTQCGFCTPGILMEARAFLNRVPDPSPDEIREALRGNLCRCTGYNRIVEAVEAAARRGG
jgi:carbon-monoxide dehydrogenase small subunit